ncbi:hypothetical protein SEA_APHELION_111 [Gordonia phage Aphelion]|uniref:Uncharacterized protein n=3 Tax=Smoothievirus TaxID=1982557 RepID=A0A410TD77_9CAUD|nr:hypothetical protein BH768_gp096 [Gordonia phage ClubL]YP_009276223.1 hypothetical protein BH772_gp099 [Gordonia phage Bachita]YP_009281265.1 hypothetical protein BIZ74_gp094 [Gordonia phage Cucurbita]QAU06976.1 hypothetical protein SEA_APHELION_111 [Gordonia phage Aphelion]QYC53596.1 hypothetical protein SEA_NORVS_112 [Gordonia phage Norvs]ANA86609.1 hypothetical protein PBI_CLUBL_111 [Gordonia phage ClubL]ANA86787.1 hypothetical protein PBI_BACHITA_112 [Gordonia phage Bachita]AOE44200.1
MSNMPNRPSVTFYDLYSRHEVTAGEIHDFIEFWHHEYEGDLELREYLGMTRNQYSYWVSHNELVPAALADWWERLLQMDRDRATIKQQKRSERAGRRWRWLPRM